MSFSKAQSDYLNELQRCLSVVEGQKELIEKVCHKIFESLKKDGVLHVFGSGHAHILAEELFHRAGGLVPVNAMLEEYLMPHMTPRRVSKMERNSGMGEMILDWYDVRKDEVLFVVSQSGINAVVVEVAEKARDRGIFVVAITSLTHSKSVPSRAGKKLFEVSDLVIDTGTPTGDACVELENSDVKVAPLSTVISAIVGELVVCRIAELYTEAGEVPPVYQSANVPGGDQRNKAYENQYRNRLKRL